jgi:hypothetical protein
MSEAPLPPDPAEWRARQRGRNRALGLVLLFFVVLFFAITIVRIGGKG